MSGSGRSGAGTGSRGRRAAVLVLLAVAVVISSLRWNSRRAGRPAVPAPPREQSFEATAPAAAPGRRRHLSPNGEEPSPVADDLNSARTDIHADLRIVNELFDQFRSATHGPNPIGDNREITAALAGGNQLGFAFIPPDHPAINAAGELVDRWGTPFFFHQLAGDQMQVRSAGPDRRLYSDDDEVLTPGLAPPHL